MEYLTTKDVCKTLHISKKKAYDLFKVKGFPCIKLGRDYIVGAEDLTTFLKSYEHSTINI